MRLVTLRVLGLVGALTLLCSFGLLTQAHPVAAAGPTGVYTHARSNSAVTNRMLNWTIIRDTSTLGARQNAAIYSPNSMMALHLEHRVKLRRDWTAEDGAYCTVKGGGQIFLAQGAPMEPGLTC